MTPRILYVEDDLSLSFVTKDQLEKRSYRVVLCENGSEAIKAFTDDHFDICILDVMLPKLDGFQLAKRIREQNKQVPIIFLTARSMKEDKLEGLTLGGDDYITKPFDLEELVLKIEIFLKRSQVNNTGQTSHNIGAYTLDLKDQTLSLNKKDVRKLTLREANLLALLCLRVNTITKREEILVKLWGENDYFLGRSLDVFISRLRKYLKKDESVTIENVRGVGFKLSVAKK